MPVPEEKTWNELNNRQRACIDSIAELELDYDLKWGSQGDDNLYGLDDVADMMDDKGVKPYGKGTISKYRSNYEDLIEERQQMIINQREEGNGTITTSKGPGKYTGPEKGIDGTMQNIDERPVKDVPEDKETIMLLPVDDDKLFRLIRSDDEEIARWVFDQLVN